RDLTVVLLEALTRNDEKFENLRLLDAMAGSGIRAIRYVKEVHGIVAVANDLNEMAFHVICHNVDKNDLNEKITIVQMDAIDCMWQYKNAFNVIDIDPFGSVASLLPSAIATIALGGIICATDTDMHTLQGKKSYSQSNCFHQYCALPVTAAYGKELAIRLILGAADRIAAACDRMIVPILSTAFDFFVRVHFRVIKRHAGTKNTLSVVHQCTKCCHYSIYKLNEEDCYSNICPICSQTLEIGGPFWHGDLQDTSFLTTSLSESNIQQYPAATRYTTKSTSKLKNYRIIKGILLEEDNGPLFYSLSRLFRPYKSIKPPSLNLFKKALISLGHIVSSSHLDPMSIKTQASSIDVYAVVKAWLTINDKNFTQATLQNIPWQSIDVFNASQFQDQMPVLIGHVIFEGNATLNIQRIHFRIPKHSTDKVHTILVSSGSVTFDNCVVEGSSPSLACVCIANGSYGLFHQCTIYNGYQAGIYVCGKSKAEIRHCNLKNMAGCGVDILGGSTCTIMASTIANCRKSGIFAHAFTNLTIRQSYIDKNAMAGIEVATHCDALIEGNHIVRGQKGGVLLHSSGQGTIRSNIFNRNCMANIDVRGIGTNAIIERNHICNGRSSGIFISDNGEATILNNTIVGNKKAGVEAQNAGKYPGGQCTKFVNPAPSSATEGIELIDQSSNTVNSTLVSDEEYARRLHQEINRPQIVSAQPLHQIPYNCGVCQTLHLVQNARVGCQFTCTHCNSINIIQPQQSPVILYKSIIIYKH
ncbi:hypothetical protein THRCLA_10318, partial [Thraustotheca clavata]